MSGVVVVELCAVCGGSVLLEADGDRKCMSCGRLAAAVAEPPASSWLELCRRDLREVLAEISRLEAEYLARVAGLRLRAEVDRCALLAAGVEVSKLPWYSPRQPRAKRG